MSGLPPFSQGGNTSWESMNRVPEAEAWLPDCGKRGRPSQGCLPGDGLSRPPASAPVSTLGCQASLPGPLVPVHSGLTATSPCQPPAGPASDLAEASCFLSRAPLLSSPSSQTPAWQLSLITTRIPSTSHRVPPWSLQ